MKVRNLSKNEIETIKIVISLLEGHDTLGSLAKETNIPKRRIQYLLSLLEKAGFVYKQEGTKRWRVQADYIRLLNNAKTLAKEEGLLKNPESEEERTVIMNHDVKYENINGHQVMFVKDKSGIETYRVKDGQEIEIKGAKVRIKNA